MTITILLDGPLSSKQKTRVREEQIQDISQRHKSTIFNLKAAGIEASNKKVSMFS